ncbi:hypothetical protein SAMN05878391_1374 [Salinicoccus kekensis]|uniref:Uncharacterized protein n=1 Tax=Salinicoccus kekensis TaxID=714307 RepID=A0A285UN74_9STAP|nr:hypothetical protein SAMN05878391_1374 [Salinicoccus kekensis]
MQTEYGIMEQFWTAQLCGLGEFPGLDSNTLCDTLNIM